MSDQYSNEILGLPRSVVDAALKNTADSVTKFIPSNANGNYFQYAGSLARTLVIFYAGRKVGWALDVTADEATFIGFILAGVGAGVWSLFKVRWASWRVNQAAKASAAASAQATMLNGTPTSVALEPVGQKV